MTSRNQDKEIPQRLDNVSEEEEEFVYRLFDALARQDQDAFKQVLAQNDKLRKKYKQMDRVYADLRQTYLDSVASIRGKYPELMSAIDSYFEKSKPRQPSN
ncbi:MAG: hypothetical protein ACXAC5_01560 [Promethearchaeota archaeon]|jgi:hypothetical protein